MITDNELTRLADMVQALRPEWPSRTTRAFLARSMRNRAYADLCAALAVVCADPESTSPARVEQPGPWWQAAKANAGRSSVPEVGPGRGVAACDRVGHEHEAARNCRACRAERLAETEADTTPLQPAPPPPEITAVAERHRRVTPGPGRRDFAQTEELRQPDNSRGGNCARCGGFYIGDGDGQEAHRTVFGHQPVAVEAKAVEAS